MSFYEIMSQLQTLKLGTMTLHHQTHEEQQQQHGQILSAVEKNVHQAHTTSHEVGALSLLYYNYIMDVN